MSTKRTIVEGQWWHVFTDARDHDDDLLYVEVKDLFAAEVSALDGCSTRVTLGIRRDTWEKIVYAYVEKRSP